MPNIHHGRPPGRRDGTRPPEGRHVPPPPSKHAALLNQLPTVRKAIAALRAAGHPDLAASVQHVRDYAREQAEQGARPRQTDNRSLSVTEEFRSRLHALAADEEARISDVVKASLQEFLDGTWTPPAPQRAPRGSNIAKVSLNVRVPDDLWDAANALGKDPGQIEARGYKLTAASVAIAALEEFARGEQENATA